MVFYFIIGVALLLGAFAMYQNYKVAKKAHQARLDAIHKQIEENEKKKLKAKLENERAKAEEKTSKD